MPYKSLEINPVKFTEQNTVKNSQIYIGYSTVNTTVTGSKLYDFDLIKQNLLNQFNTRKGEKLMDPEFGTVIWDILHDPFTDSVKSVISDDIDRILTSDPRAVPVEIIVNEQEYGIIIEATLKTVETNQIERLNFNFDKSIGFVQ
jgi:phage baseplate assembly protein W